MADTVLECTFRVSVCLFLVTLRIVAMQPTCPSTGDGYDADVLVLGAGMAGIAASRTLHEAGVTRLLILEARDRIGGRMRSEAFGGTMVELGANWIHGVNQRHGSYINPIMELAKRCGLHGYVVPPSSWLVVYNGSQVLTWLDPKYAPIAEKFDKARERMNEESLRRQELRLSDITARQAFIDNNWTDSTHLGRLTEYVLHDLDYGEPPEVCSLFLTYPDLTNEEFGNDVFMVVDKRGYAHLVHCIADEFLSKDDPRLQLNTLVTGIQYSNQCVCVQATTAGRRRHLCAKYAIVTFSIGVLQDEQSRRMFHPPLPAWKTNAIDRLTMINLLKIFAKFDHIFWDASAHFIGYSEALSQPLYQEFLPIRNSTTGAPTNILVAMVTYTLADTVISQPDEITKHQIQQTLQRMYPNANVPLPDELFIPSWKIDPLYRGCYSNAHIGATPQDFKDIGAPLGKLHFSGEGTNRKFHGYVHGAYFAGIHTGREIVRLKNATGSSQHLSSNE